MTTPDENSNALHFQLPPIPTPKGAYKPCLIVGKFIYVSGTVQAR